MDDPNLANNWAKTEVVVNIPSPCQTGVDTDSDDGDDEDEDCIGTDCEDDCTDPGSDDLDAWPPDLSMNGQVHISDAVRFKYKLFYCESELGYDPRYDLSQSVTSSCSPPEKAVNITDVVWLKPYMFEYCY